MLNQGEKITVYKGMHTTCEICSFVIASHVNIHYLWKWNTDTDCKSKFLNFCPKNLIQCRLHQSYTFLHLVIVVTVVAAYIFVPLPILFHLTMKIKIIYSKYF